MTNSDIFDKFDLLPENKGCIKLSVDSDLRVSIITSKVNCLLDEIDAEYIKSMTGLELLSFVQNMTALNFWDKIQMDKGFNWISHVGIIAGRNVKDDGYPDLDSFSFLVKGKGSIFRSGGNDPKYSFIETKTRTHENSDA